MQIGDVMDHQNGTWSLWVADDMGREYWVVVRGLQPHRIQGTPWVDYNGYEYEVLGADLPSGRDRLLVGAFGTAMDAIESLSGEEGTIEEGPG